jgi:AraC-like DNA-binding protein
MHHANGPRIRITSLKGLPRLLKSKGVDVGEILGTFDLEADDTNRPGFFVSYPVYAAILSASAGAARCPHIALLLAQEKEHDLSVTGALGVLIRQSMTAGEAFAAMARNYSSHSQGAKYRLELEGDRACLIREGLIPSLKHDRRLQDLSLADFFRFFKFLCGPGFQCHAVSFTYAEPEDTRPYEKFFDCPVRFGQERQALIFDAAALQHPVGTPEPMMETILEGFQSPRVLQPDAPLRRSVLSAIESSMGTGKCSAAAVAALFDMHPRTLHRQLSDEGTTFSELLVEKRREMAEAYLRETPMPLQQISEALGYSNPSIFTRAWKRWTGQAPSDWREEHLRREAV